MALNIVFESLLVMVEIIWKKYGALILGCVWLIFICEIQANKGVCRIFLPETWHYDDLRTLGIYLIKDSIAGRGVLWKIKTFIPYTCSFTSFDSFFTRTFFCS